jgi:hypothetical protein
MTLMRLITIKYFNRLTALKKTQPAQLVQNCKLSGTILYQIWDLTNLYYNV